MKHLRTALGSLVFFLFANIITFSFVLQSGFSVSYLLFGLCLFGLSLYFLILPQKNRLPSAQLNTLANGNALLTMFLPSVCATTFVQFYALYRLFALVKVAQQAGGLILHWLFSLLFAVLVQAGLFWCGMLRIYTTSVQLGIKRRVIAALLGWIPIANLVYLGQMIKIVNAEITVEAEKQRIDAARHSRQICRTKYPFLLVHGVFFRDFRYFGYWGRIPKALEANGALVFYGEQQSADTVEHCGQELSARIAEIVSQTGCGKVNIIAHSKGGLDSRAAISHFGAAPYVASLTTINTPHEGCLFAEHLLSTMPEKVRQGLAESYNTVLLRLGDTSPDFIGAVTDLTASACKQFNAQTPDAPEVYYQSVMSYCKQAQSGKFPLNISYPIVKKYDGKNDGLVAIEAARWGKHFTLVEPVGTRGISHGDMIDLNRENIQGFDVREFYVNLVSRLKQMGF